MPAKRDAKALLETAEELAQLGGWELDVETLRVRWTAGMYRVHGLAPESAPPSLETLHGRVHPHDRDRMQALVRQLADHPELVAPEGIVDAYRALWDDGSVHHLRFLARVEDHRLVGIAQDVTAEQLIEQELRAHYAVSQALREWECFDEGVAALLRRMATAMEYPLAALWLWDEKGKTVRCRAFWHSPDIDPGDFEAAVRATHMPPGLGKPGLAWRDGEPILTPDISTDPGFRLREPALKVGVQSALAFPAMGPDGPLAVLSFYSTEKRSEPKPAAHADRHRLRARPLPRPSPRAARPALADRA